ncbi:MAG: ATPase [Marinilabiliales bacterium]|nr:MAG: ATPase [Marinilabiliales bacterium]
MLHKNRISITGPESCGKSLLAKQLAEYYNTNYCEEVSRNYLKNKTAYDYEDILEIAKLQLKKENDLYEARNSIIFCDTDILVNLIWSKYVFNKVDNWITDKFTKHEYGLYLLCYPDIEWEFDPLRENPTNREELFQLYENELKTFGYNYVIIRGKGNKRILSAVNAVNKYLSTI